MSSESNYAGASMMSEGSQASFVVEVTNKIFKDLPLVFFKLQLEGDTILYFCNDFFIEIVKIFALLTKGVTKFCLTEDKGEKRNYQQNYEMFVNNTTCTVHLHSPLCALSRSYY